MSASAAVEPHIAPTAEPLWFLGTLVRPKLSGAQTGGRFALWEGVLPRGASPPLHSHPQDETFYVLDGRVVAWAVDAQAAADGTWIERDARPCESGAAIFVPGGTPHTFRVDSDTARMLFLSTPAGIEDFIGALAEPARWPWLEPPPDGPRVPLERMEAAEHEHGVIRFAPPPPVV